MKFEEKAINRGIIAGIIGNLVFAILYTPEVLATVQLPMIPVIMLFLGGIGQGIVYGLIVGNLFVLTEYAIKNKMLRAILLSDGLVLFSLIFFPSQTPTSLYFSVTILIGYLISGITLAYIWEKQMF